MLGFPIQRQPRLRFDSKGVSLLIAIVILGSALLIISASALMIGLGGRERGFVETQGGETRSLADGCMDEAYLRIARDPSWGLAGSILLAAPNGSCSIEVSDLGGNMRRIDVSATHNTYVSHIRSTTTIGSDVTDWQELSD